MISKTTIDAVFETARVEEVIGDFVQLKKSGSNFKGLSPFSDERTPSFMVSPVKQIWKDFSSGKGGNAVAFLMEHEHFTYPEAIKYLAKKYNIEVEETEQTDEQKEQANERESMYVVSEFARDYFHKTLLNSEQGKAIGLSYFKERGFTEETIEKFQLGYSPDVWDAFTSEAIRKGYKLEFLEKTGLTIVKEEKQFDRFKGRVMFPIHSLSGRVLGFGGRILTNEKKAAKYLNSPESEIYHKSKVLYGIYYAKQAIAKEDNCYLVEGYTDVIQLHQLGIENVVSSSGTALTPEQIRLINRLTPNITVLFDGDAAGQRASLRGIDLILEQGMNVKVCSFPEGEDPDSFSKSHTLTEVEDFLKKNAKDFIQYKASLLVKEAQGDPIKKAGLVRDMVESIAKIPDVIKREIYVQECARIMDIKEDVLFNTLAQIRNKGKKDAVQTTEKRPAEGEMIPLKNEEKVKFERQYELEQNIIKLLITFANEPVQFVDLVYDEDKDGKLIEREEKRELIIYEKIYLDLQEDEVEFANDDFKAIYPLLIEHLTREEGDIKLDQLGEVLPASQMEKISSIAFEPEKHTLHAWDRHEIYVKTLKENSGLETVQTLLNLRHFLIQRKMAEFGEQLKTGELPENAQEFLEDYKDYKTLEVLIAKKRNLVIMPFMR
ncbi:DNA primase [Leeuwenhoekiella palythoae]|uniref:DNA primase n=1 Tax=Leeuwenhoekiella palythoae TaxID=573501 RepID=A0A1M5YU28_9FLAO|nr:DNA primase [Leeuwenhoekiella palythoae]RXG29533.1 DNA primase [Leeuwenhoekiella palythoae]SHI15607.1 DNA primase [Leeuwenhoekiella palythoae]